MVNLTGSLPPKLISPELNEIQLTTNISTESTGLHQQKLYSHAARILKVIGAPRVSEADERQWIVHLAEEVVGLTLFFFFSLKVSFQTSARQWFWELVHIPYIMAKMAIKSQMWPKEQITSNQIYSENNVVDHFLLQVVWKVKQPNGDQRQLVL